MSSTATPLAPATTPRFDPRREVAVAFIGLEGRMAFRSSHRWLSPSSAFTAGGDVDRHTDTDLRPPPVLVEPSPVVVSVSLPLADGRGRPGRVPGRR